MNRPTFSFDATKIMKATGLIDTSGANANVIDLGPEAPPQFLGLVIDVGAIEIADDDETYTIVVQGSNDANFGTAGNIVDLVSLQLGAKETKPTDSDRDDSTGRRIIGIYNVGEDNVPLRYLRLYDVVGGSVATGINYWAALVPLKTA